MLAPILQIGSQIIDKIFPDKNEAAKAKLELAKMEQEGKLEELNLYLADTQNARAREMAVKDNVPKWLALSVTLGFFGVLLLVYLNKGGDNQLLDIMVGFLGNSWAGIIGYYFGSSNGSKLKEIHLQHMQSLQQLKK